MITVMCCAGCKWYEHEEVSSGNVCVNVDSDYCTEWTDADHYCDRWEALEA